MICAKETVTHYFLKEEVYETKTLGKDRVTTGKDRAAVRKTTVIKRRIL